MEVKVDNYRPDFPLHAPCHFPNMYHSLPPASLQCPFPLDQISSSRFSEPANVRTLRLDISQSVSLSVKAAASLLVRHENPETPEMLGGDDHLVRFPDPPYGEPE